MLQSLAYLQRKINYGHQLTKMEGIRINSHEKNEKLNPRKKGFRPHHLLKQQRQPSQALIELAKIMREKLKEPLECWGCEGPHMGRNCPLANMNEGQVPSTQEAETVGQ